MEVSFKKKTSLAAELVNIIKSLKGSYITFNTGNYIGVTDPNFSACKTGIDFKVCSFFFDRTYEDTGSFRKIEMFAGF